MFYASVGSTRGGMTRCMPRSYLVINIVPEFICVLPMWPILAGESAHIGQSQPDRATSECASWPTSPGRRWSIGAGGYPSSELLQPQRQFEPSQMRVERTIEGLLDLMEAVFDCVPGHFQLVSR